MMIEQFKFIYLIIFLLSVGCASNKNSIDKHINKNKGLDIFLLIGQSNMSGVAKIGALDTISLQNVYLFNDQNEWEKARNLFSGGINRYSTVIPRAPKLGPGYTFAKKIADVTKKKIGLVSNARGGTRIDWWQKGYTGENDYDLYEEAVARLKAALAVSPNSKLKGIIWHQGEGDNSKKRSVVYMDRLKALITDLRADLRVTQLPIIVGEVGKWNERGKGVNPVLRQIKENITNSEWVSSDGLTSINLKKNDPHFDTFSQRVFGARYADKALELIYNTSPGVVEVFIKVGFSGRNLVLVPGKYSQQDLEKMGIGDKEIRSLTILPGYKALLYGKNFEDKPLKLTKDTPNIQAKFSAIQIKNL